MLLLDCGQLRPRTSDADDQFDWPNGSKSHTPFEMKSSRPSKMVPNWLLAIPTVAQRLKRPPGAWPFIPHKLVPQSPLSARKRCEAPVAAPFGPMPVGTPFMYSSPPSSRPYNVT